MGIQFDDVFDRIVGNEGGFQCQRNDRGNWTSGKVGVGELKGTKFGISAMTYPNLDIKNLTREDAKKLFYTDWWVKLGMSRFPVSLAYQMVDAAYHSGSHWANVFLQRALGVNDDGLIGANTLSTLKAVEDLDDVFFLFLAARLEFLTKTAAWGDNSRGFALRIARCLRYASGDYC